MLSKSECLDTESVWKKWHKIIGMQNGRIYEKLEDYFAIAIFCTVAPADIMAKVSI